MMRVLAANRRALARRIVRTCRGRRMSPVAVYCSEDTDRSHPRGSDSPVEMRGPMPQAACLDGTQLIEVARRAGRKAFHPGYALLSERWEIARDATAAELLWVGPSSAAMSAMVLKPVALAHAARVGIGVAQASNVAIVRRWIATPEFLPASPETRLATRLAPA